MYVSFKEAILIKFSDCEYIVGGKIFAFGSMISVLLKYQDPVILQPLVLGVYGLPQQCLTWDTVFLPIKRREKVRSLNQ